MRTVYADGVAGLLLICGLWHVVAPGMAERWMCREGTIRWVGAGLVLLALPCLLWRNWYFLALFAALTLSGLWRLLFPRNSIRAQQWSYPRQVHGVLLIGGAVLVWLLGPV